MSNQANSIVQRINFCDICNLSFCSRKDFLKQTLSSGHQKRARDMIMDLDEAERARPLVSQTTAKSKRASPLVNQTEGTLPPAKTMEMMYDSDEDFINPKPSTKFKTETINKNNIKDFIKPKPEPKLKPKDNIYIRIRFDCKESHAEFKNKVALTTHSYSHNRKYLENTEYFDINSGQNMKELNVTDKAKTYIEDIEEAINNSLEEIYQSAEPFHGFGTQKLYNIII